MKCALPPLGVEELHLARLGAHRAELLAGAEGAVDHGAVGRAPQLRAHERPALAGLDVLELDDLEDDAVDVDVVAVLELVGVDRHGGPVYAGAVANLFHALREQRRVAPDQLDQEASMAVGIRMKAAGWTAEDVDRLNVAIDPDGNPPEGFSSTRRVRSRGASG